MRKNLLSNVLQAPSSPKSDVNRHGPARSMTRSIEELAENTKRMQDGELVVNLRPDLIDGSFVSDRIEDNDDDDYGRLRNAIVAHGQSTPILVRPHPQIPGRFMIVYGHRRVRVAKELDRPVLAVITNLEDVTHVITQGQENSARADLSFIEKARFAKRLLDNRQSKETIKAALSIDDTLLSRMLGVAETVPIEVLLAVGAAKGVGRDRWEALKRIIIIPAKAERARECILNQEFLARTGSARFDYLLAEIKSGRRSAQGKPVVSWSSADKAVEATYQRSTKGSILVVTSRSAKDFGDYLSSNLARLYADFNEEKRDGDDGTAL